MRLARQMHRRELDSVTLWPQPLVQNLQMASTVQDGSTRIPDNWLHFFFCNGRECGHLQCTKHNVSLGLKGDLSCLEGKNVRIKPEFY